MTYQAKFNGPFSSTQLCFLDSYFLFLISTFEKTFQLVFVAFDSDLKALMMNNLNVTQQIFTDDLQKKKSVKFCFAPFGAVFTYYLCSIFNFVEITNKLCSNRF